MTVVDLVVPSYADAAALDGLVDSALGQTDPSWRLTIVDDAYPDDALRAWSSTLHDDRIRYLRNPTNLGLTANFTRCLSLVRHELVTFVGSDDLLLPGYIATVRNAYARHPYAAMVQPGVVVVDGAGRPATSLVDLVKRRVYAPRRRDEVVLEGEELAVSLLRGNWLYFPSLCWRADAIRAVGFSDTLHTVIDLASEIAVAEAGGALVSTPAVCFRYRRHAGSVSSWRARDGSRFAEERAFFLEVALRMRSRGWHRAAGAARRHLSSRLHALTTVPVALRAGAFGEVPALVRHIVARSPGRRREGRR